MSAMRIAKYPAICGIGLDPHTVEPPSLPPVPPAPPNPMKLPFHPWIVTICNQAPPLIFGKFTLTNSITEYLGDMIAGHDWGMGQPHIPMPPVVTPQMVLVTMASSHKYFLPSYAVKETLQGGALALAGASGKPVAIVTPGFMISLQDCIESFVAPVGVGFNVPTVRWVGFGLCDLAAGAISLVGDGVAAAASDAIGDKLEDAFGEVAGAVLSALLDCANSVAQDAADAHTSGGQSAAAGIAMAFSGVLGPAAIGLGAGTLADMVGDSPHEASAAAAAP